MPLAILTASEARAAGCGETDTITFRAAEENAKAGRPGFWSAHSYHQANLTTAASIANDEGLDAACRYVAEGASDRRWNRVEWVAHFLDRLHPANPAARTDLILARAKWCASFDTEAA